MTPRELRRIDGRVALEVFGWRRWRYKGDQGGIPNGTIILAPPDWSPTDWVEGASVFYDAVEDDTGADYQGYLSTPDYTSDWNAVQQIVRYLGENNSTWTMFWQHLGVQLNRRKGVAGTNDEARGHEIWRSVQPIDICLAALDVAASHDWRAQSLIESADHG